MNQLFSRRQSQQLVVYVAGDEDIARDLGISYRTTKNHVYNIFNKLGIHSRSEAIHIGICLRLLNKS